MFFNRMTYSRVGLVEYTLEPEDLDLMLHGKDRNICLEDWKAHTEYHDYCATDDQVVWFWQVRIVFVLN